MTSSVLQMQTQSVTARIPFRLFSLQFTTALSASHAFLSSMSAFPSIKLTYFATAGRAEAPRLAFYLGGVPFEDKRINHAQFQAMKDSLPLGQVPTLEVDGEVFTQSHAILRYAGRLAGLYPSSAPYLALKIDELLHAFGEVEEKMGPSFRESDPAKKKAMREEIASAVLPRYADLFEARLERMQTLPAFQSGELYVHDVVIYTWVKSMRAGYIDFIPATVLDGYKLLNETFEKVANHPKVKEWYSLQHNTPKLKLTYMPHPGRGEPIRLAFFIGGIEFEDERITREELANRKPSLPFNQLPALEVDGEVIAQSLAILRYAGTLSGLYPVTDAVAAYRIDELFAILDDMFNYPLWGASHREKDTEKQLAMRAELASGMVPKTLGFLENRIVKNKGPYAAGSKLTVADLAIYGALLGFKNGVPGFEKTIADSYTILQRVFKQVAEHPKVVEWNAAHNQYMGKA
jgi:glutathione S-transferase